MCTGLLCVFYSCEQNSDENGLSHNQLQGRVTLENQTEHDGIIVYLSGADVGAVTDLEGNFILSIPDTVDTSGVFTLYYYHTNYDLGQLEIHVEGNSINSNMGDVDEDNHLPTEQLEQVFEISQTLDDTVVTHGDILRGTTTVKNVYNDTIVIGGLGIFGEDLKVRDWVLFNVLGHDYSIVYFENDEFGRDWVTLAPGNESTIVFSVPICTTGCSFGYVAIPGEYYYVPMIYPETGHPYAPYKAPDLWRFLKDNHNYLMFDEFVYDAHINLDRLGYLIVTIQ